MNNNRLLSKFACADEVQGGDGAQKSNVTSQDRLVSISEQVTSELRTPNSELTIQPTGRIVKMFDTRIEMIKELIPGNSILCELGVFKGDFASELYKLNPKHLYLCDLWPNAPLYSGNEDGRHGEFYNGVDLYEHVSCRFYDNLNISIYRECSDTFIKKLPDAFLDGVYIDANHSYDAVKLDLNAIFPKMKCGGVIMGHDYECNPAKASESFETGVKQAVDEFCQERNLEINAKANDGCVSFAIRLLSKLACADEVQGASERRARNV